MSATVDSISASAGRSLHGRALDVNIRENHAKRNSRNTTSPMGHGCLQQCPVMRVGRIKGCSESGHRERHNGVTPRCQHHVAPERPRSPCALHVDGSQAPPGDGPAQRDPRQSTTVRVEHCTHGTEGHNQRAREQHGRVRRQTAPRGARFIGMKKRSTGEPHPKNTTKGKFLLPRARCLPGRQKWVCSENGPPRGRAWNAGSRNRQPALSRVPPTPASPAQEGAASSSSTRPDRTEPRRPRQGRTRTHGD